MLSSECQELQFPTSTDDKNSFFFFWSCLHNTWNVCSVYKSGPLVMSQTWNWKETDIASPERSWFLQPVPEFDSLLHGHHEAKSQIQGLFASWWPWPGGTPCFVTKTVLDLLAVQGTLKGLLQHNSSQASILQCSAFFVVQLSYSYMTTGKTIDLTRRTFKITE